MFEPEYLRQILQAWQSILSVNPKPVLHSEGRELWRIVASDSADYFLKRLGPWRNLPLEDEAEVLEYLAGNGIRTAPFAPTDDGEIFAGRIEDSFVLIPEMEHIPLTPRELLTREEAIGSEIARLQHVLAGYPGEVRSYRESVLDSIGGDLNLPHDLAEGFKPRIPLMLESFTGLPEQLIHGDLTPENILLGSADTPPGFIDFEHLPVGPRIWDIAKYASRKMRTRWFGDSQPADTDRLNHVGHALRGYHAVCALDCVEIRALPGAILAANIVEVSYFRDISDGKLQRRMLPDHDDVLMDSIEAATWQLQNFDLVISTLSEVLHQA